MFKLALHSSAAFAFGLSAFALTFLSISRGIEAKQAFVELVKK